MMQHYIEEDLTIHANNPVTCYPIDAERDEVRRILIAIASHRDVKPLLQAACWTMQFVGSEEIRTLKPILKMYLRGATPPAGNGTVDELMAESRSSGKGKASEFFARSSSGFSEKPNPLVGWEG